MTLTRYDILKATSEILEDNRTLDPDLRTSWNEASIYLDEILCALDSEGVGDDGIDTIALVEKTGHYPQNVQHVFKDIT